MCKVLNKHAAGIPADAVYIGRGSKWGNPFRIGQHGDRAVVIARHETWLRDQHDLLRSIGELRGKDLVCFCAPAPCHGDLLLRLANGSREDMIMWWRAGGTRPNRRDPERHDLRRPRDCPSSTP
jgi:hypothetical protein